MEWKMSDMMEHKEKDTAQRISDPFSWDSHETEAMLAYEGGNRTATTKEEVLDEDWKTAAAQKKEPIPAGAKVKITGTLQNMYGDFVKVEYNGTRYTVDPQKLEMRMEGKTNEKPICEVSEYYGDNVFMLVSRVNKALRRAGQEKKAEEWNREYKEQPDYEAVWELAKKYVTII